MSEPRRLLGTREVWQAPSPRTRARQLPHGSSGSVLAEGWRELSSTDQAALEDFVCTVPLLGGKHERPWEYETQAYISTGLRTWVVASDNQLNATAWGKWIEGNLAAVLHLEYSASYGGNMIKVYARSLRFRGGGIGAEILRTAEILTLSAEGVPRVDAILARVWNRNHRSRRLLEKMAYEKVAQEGNFVLYLKYLEEVSSTSGGDDHESVSTSLSLDPRALPLDKSLFQSANTPPSG